MYVECSYSTPHKARGSQDLTFIDVTKYVIIPSHHNLLISDEACCFTSNTSNSPGYLHKVFTVRGQAYSNGDGAASKRSPGLVGVRWCVRRRVKCGPRETALSFYLMEGFPHHYRRKVTSSRSMATDPEI